MYRVRVVEPGCPGAVLYTADRPSRCHAWIERTGAAYEYHYGVAIQRCNDGLFDHGDGHWGPYEVG